MNEKASIRIEHGTSRLSRGFLKLCAGLMVLGAISIVAGNILGTVIHPTHDPIADTISDLGAGEYEIFQDVALYGYAIGILGLALGLAHRHDGSKRWTTGICALVAVAGLVIVVAARNEYGGGDNEGAVIHVELVCALGALLVVAPLCLARGLRHIGQWFGTASVGFAVLWTFAAPVFFFLPTSIDGGYERALGVLVTLWFLSVARALASFSNRA